MNRIEELTRQSTKKYANQRYFEKDFSGQDLSNADFRSAQLHRCNFEGSDLSYAIFDGANCYEANFKDSIMYKTSFKDAVLARAIFEPKKCFGLTITLNCDSFEGVKINRTLWLYWLFFPTLMEPPTKELETMLINALGQQEYIALTKVFKEQVL